MREFQIIPHSGKTGNMEGKKLQPLIVIISDLWRILKRVGLWDGIRHIIIGGVGGSCAVYQVKKGEIVYLDVDKYNSLHPEADTQLFTHLKHYWNIIMQKSLGQQS